MTKTYQLNADDLDITFVEKVKEMFRHQEIGISIKEMDTTEYLMSNPKTAARLLESIEDFKTGRNLIELDRKMFEWCE